MELNENLGGSITMKYDVISGGRTIKLSVTEQKDHLFGGHFKHFNFI